MLGAIKLIMLKTVITADDARNRQGEHLPGKRSQTAAQRQMPRLRSAHRPRDSR